MLGAHVRRSHSGFVLVDRFDDLRRTEGPNSHFVCSMVVEQALGHAKRAGGQQVISLARVALLWVALFCGERKAGVSSDQVCGFFCNHDGGSVGIAPNQGWHNGGIYYP